MATSIGCRLCSRALQESLKLKIVQPYHCYLLTKFDSSSPKTSLYSFNSISTIQQFNGYQMNYATRNYSTDLKKNQSEDVKCSNDTSDDKKENKLSLLQRFKQMYRDYWYVLVPVHLATSAAWFGGFYYLASSGMDIPALLESMNFSEKIINSMRNSSMGYVAISYGLYKIATPARYAVTLGGTTISIQYLKKWGYIKPMPSTERLKEMYKEKKEEMIEKKENILETVKETKKGIKDKKDSFVSSVKDSKDGIKHIKKQVSDSVKVIKKSK